MTNNTFADCIHNSAIWRTVVLVM